MKMVKKTLIAIALVAFLASTAPASVDVYYWGINGDGAQVGMDKEVGVKSDNRTYVYWPYEYKALDICKMDIKMNVGMYVDVKDCTDEKLILNQVECSEINKSEYPCYWGCQAINVRANFDVKLGTRIDRIGGSLNSGKVEGYYDGGNDVITGDGNYHSATVCVRAWSVDLWNQPYGHEVKVGTLYITAKPNFAPDVTYTNGWPGQYPPDDDS